MIIHLLLINYFFNKIKAKKMSSAINQRVSLVNKNNNLINQIELLKVLCFSTPESSMNQKSVIKYTLKIMKGIMKPYHLVALRNIEPHDLLTCSIKIIFLCHEDMYIKLKNPYKLKYNKNYELSKIYYYELLNIFFAERVHEIISFIIKLISKEELWQWELLSYDLIYGLCRLNFSTFYILNYFLDIIESDNTNNNTLRDIFNIINKLFDNQYIWIDTINISTTTERLLNKYYNLIIENTSSPITYNKNILKRSLDILFYNIINNLSNDYLLVVITKMSMWIFEQNNKENIKNTICQLEDTIELAMKNYKLNLLKDTMKENLFFHLMKMISSSNKDINLFGNRIFQDIIDRSDNKKKFLAPEIFYQDKNYSININKEPDKRDVEFLKKNRELIHDTLVTSIIKHAGTKVNLESVYCSICLLAVEIPSGFTAAALVCLVMNIQDLTLQSTSLQINRQVCYHIHATVIAIMSLICRIHNAKILYNYVNKIMMERAQWAPHLNPPLINNYVFAIHYVLWNKPELFFVDWEARFGLWKCFRTNIYQDSISYDDDIDNISEI